MLIDVVIRDVVETDADAILGILNPIIAARIYTAFDKPFRREAEHHYIAGVPSRGVWEVAQRQSIHRRSAYRENAGSSSTGMKAG